MLAFYGSVLDTVEMNSTFYRAPTKDTLEGWASQVPDGFRFTLKASRWMSHHLKVEGQAIDFFERAAVMGAKLGPVLVQVPPYNKLAPERIRSFAASIPNVKLAFEFLDPSWFHEETYVALREAKAALSISEAAKLEAPLIVTASFAYVRLRLKYSDAAIAAWAAKIQALACEDVFVYFKHKESVSGPLLAKKLRKRLNPPTPGSGEPRSRRSGRTSPR
jgi:uncharacterized protein YecE (DUF72 family)